MAVQNITQLRRVVFRKWDADTSSWSVFTLEADDLGQDTVMTLNVAPRKRSRASSLGTSETAISGTFDSFSGSITFLMDTFKNLGQAIQKWNAATYAGASATAGNIIWDGTDICAEGDYMSVVAQGLCDDGSSVDVELTRCVPSVDDDIEIGTGDTPTITLNLNPIIYNSALHSADGYPQYSVRLGDYDLTTKMRLNASTGVYSAGGSALGVKMTAPEITLRQAKKAAEVKNFRASDFLTKEELDEVHESNIKGKKKARFDKVDAYVAEILARFGYDTYVAWKFGEIDAKHMVKYIEAERAREAQNRLMIENVIVASVAGANNATKGGHPPKSLKTAIKMLKNEQKLAKGAN